jgi:hypothetical protein
MPSETQMIKTSRKLCRTCKYCTHNTNKEVSCNYIIITHRSRNCEIGWCDKYQKEVN